jgi:hypothetical protein
VVALSSVAACRSQKVQPEASINAQDIRVTDDHIPFICEDQTFQVAVSNAPTGIYAERIATTGDSVQSTKYQLTNVRKHSGGLEAVAGSVPLHIESMRKAGFHEHLAWGRLSCWR